MTNRNSRHLVAFSPLFALLICWFALANSLWMPKAITEAEASLLKSAPETITSSAALPTSSSIKMREAVPLQTTYLGAANLRTALAQNQTRPLSLASGDFDEDGVPDLVCGYASQGAGLLTLHRGNVDPLFPHTALAQQRKANGQFTETPFLSSARAFASPEAPELIATGDFNADGHWDILTAARDSRTLHFLPGDGRGKFGVPQSVELPGNVKALASGEINRADGLIDLAVAVSGERGSQVLVFESPDGAMRAKPEIFDLPNDATALAMGLLDDDMFRDLAVAAGSDVLTIKGRDRRLSLDETRRAEASPAIVTERSFPWPVTDIAIGDFEHSKMALMFENGTVQMLGPDSERGMHKQNAAQSGFEQWTSKDILKVSGQRGARLIRARLSTHSGEDLLISDSSHLRIVTGGLEMKAAARDLAGEPAAILPMQLNTDAINDLVMLRTDLSAPSIMLTAPSATFTVTTNSSSGFGSLRDAITQANSSPGPDTINFAIGSGLQTISLLSPLPAITEAVTIDGTTQPGFSGAPLIVLNGISAGTTARGLQINAANCLIEGLVINGFAKTGLFIGGAGSSGNQVQGCYIGTNAAGTAAVSNGTVSGTFDVDGLDLVSGANNNIIGGTTAAARNLISGNFTSNGDGIFIGYPGSNNNLIQGNYLGTNAAGTAAIANGFAGLEIATDVSPGPQGNVIGGTTAGSGNIASGNSQVGIGIFNADSDNNLVQGNFIGTDVAGTASVPNGIAGAEIGNPPGGGISGKNNLIGGTTPSARNIISGNFNNGVWIRDAGTTNNLVQGNYIGTTSTGMTALPNTLRGVELAYGAQANTIGGVVASARNILSGNGDTGISIFNPGTNSNVVQGNYIGLDLTGLASVAVAKAPLTTGEAASNSNRSSHPKFGGSPNEGFSQTPNLPTRTLSLNLVSASPSSVGNSSNGVAILANAQNNLIGGTSAGARNVISGNAIDGVFIVGTGTNNNLVQGNFIGLNESGTGAVPNGAGVEISFGGQNNVIGGTVAGAGNVISGNGKAVTYPNGILIGSPTTINNRVQGNLIGTLADGISALGNFSHGIVFIGTAGSGNNIENGNTIAFNGGSGVYADSGFANRISGNSIHSNAVLGIDLVFPLGVNSNDACDGDFGPNNLQNYPVLSAVTSDAASTMIQGTLNSSPSTTFTLEFFVNPACDVSGNGEGKMFIGSTSVTTNPNCTVSFNLSLPVSSPIGQFLTATATDPAGNTSEFSMCAQITPACVFSIAPTTQTFTAAGGSDMVAVNTTSGCTWMAVSNDSFIMITSASSGVGSGGITYAVAANLSANPRSGTMTIAGNTFTVYQSGVTCAGLISPASAMFTSSGGSDMVTVPAPMGCGWTAVSNDSWIIVTSGSPGSGNGTVQYSVQPNSGQPRQGSITIASQLFIVTQNSGLQYFSLAHPVRLLDTRLGASACFQPNAPIPGGTSYSQMARVLCDGLTIPANAAAITGNITTVQSGGGFLTLYSSDAMKPFVANSNFGPDEIINNVFTVGLGASDGAFKIFVTTDTDVVVDVTGYYAPPGTGGLYFHPLPSPVRLLDTRTGATVGCFRPGSPLVFDTENLQTATSACTGIPAAALAIVGNATTVNPLSNGFLTLFPANATRPVIASSNFTAGRVVNGPFTVGLSSMGEFKIYTAATTDLVVDLLGYYSPEAIDANGAGLLFTPLRQPVRLLETRAGEPVGCYKPGAPLIGGSTYTQPARGTCGGEMVPSSALGLVGNATAVFPVANGFLTLWPSAAIQPTVATSNYRAGRVYNRHFIVGLGNADGAFKIFSAATTNLVVDLSGYFAP